MQIPTPPLSGFWPKQFCFLQGSLCFQPGQTGFGRLQEKLRCAWEHCVKGGKNGIELWKTLAVMLRRRDSWIPSEHPSEHFPKFLYFTGQPARRPKTAIFGFICLLSNTVLAHYSNKHVFWKSSELTFNTNLHKEIWPINEWQALVHHLSQFKYKKQEPNSDFSTKNFSKFLLPSPKETSSLAIKLRVIISNRILMNFPVSSRADSQHCRNPSCDHTLLSYLRDRIPKKKGAQKCKKTPLSSPEILTVLAYTSGTFQKHHQKLRADPPFQEALSKCKGAIIASQTREKTCTAVFWTSCEWDNQAILGDLLRRNDSTPTSRDQDMCFCCEAITMINKGVASTSCATGKNTSYPHILLLASHRKGTIRSDAKILNLLRF